MQDMENEAFADDIVAAESGDTDATGIMKHVRTGVEHFVSFLGDDAFYGLVRGTTLEALLLRVVNATISARVFEPVIVPAFHVRGESALALDAADDDDAARLAGYEESAVGGSGGGGGDGFRLHERLTRIRKYIRAVNFQLLQIVRPDRLFANHKRLPRAYLQEYIERQEHFSAANLIRSLSAPDLPRETSRKWLVTTRTCPEISQLPVLPEMQRRLISDTLHGTVKVLSLTSFTSGAQLTEAVQGTVAAAGGRPLMLVLVADRSELRDGVINFAVRVVDTIVDGRAGGVDDVPPVEEDGGGATESKGGDRDEAPHERARITAVILQHYPSELGQFKALCTVAHLNGWEFSYVDALGLDFSGERDGDDARPMLAAAFGLRSLTPASLSEDLRPAMVEQIVVACKDLRVRPLAASVMARLDCPATAPALFGAPNARDAMARAWLAAQPSVLGHCLELAAGTWTRVLRKILARADGEADAVDSMLHHVHDSLAAVLRGVARHTILGCAAAYGLEALIAPRYGGSGDAGVHEAVVRAGLAAGETPSDEALHAAARMSVLWPSVPVAFAPRLPFFYRLIAGVAAARATVLSHASAAPESDDALAAAVAAAVARSRIAPLVHEIDALPDAWPDVLRGLCGIVLGAWACSDLELRVLSMLLEQHVRGGERSCVRAVFAAKHHGTEIVAAVPILAPLRHLRQDAVRRPEALLESGAGEGDAIGGGAGRHNREVLERLRCNVTAAVDMEARRLVHSGTMRTDVMRAVRDVVASASSAADIPAACHGGYLTCWLVRHAALWLQNSVEHGLLWTGVANAIAQGESGGWDDVYDVLPRCVGALLEWCAGVVAAEDAAALVAETFRFMLGGSGPPDVDVYMRCARDLGAVTEGTSAPGGAPAAAGEVESVGTALLRRLHPRLRLSLWRTLLTPPQESPAGAAVRGQLSVALDAEARAAARDSDVEGEDEGDVPSRGLASAASYISDACAAATAIFAAAGDIAAAGVAVDYAGGRGSGSSATGLAALVYAALSAIEHSRVISASMDEMEARLLAADRAGEGAYVAIARMELAVRYIEATAAAYAANPASADRQSAREHAALTAALSAAPEAAVLLIVRPSGVPEWSPAVVRGLLSTELHRQALCIPRSWHVPAEGVAAASPSRTVCSVLRSAPWGAEYALLARVLTRDGDLRGPLSEWIAAQPRSEAARTRALLFLVPLHVRFNAKLQTPGLAEAVRNAAGVLGFTDADAAVRVYELLGNGPHEERCTADAGVRYFFSSASFEGHAAVVAGYAIERGHLGVLMATLLTLQKERCYYAACFFTPEFVLRGCGLGSDHSGIAKVHCLLLSDFLSLYVCMYI
jgi:hypothetical protein